jgi:hypothetical protein
MPVMDGYVASANINFSSGLVSLQCLVANGGYISNYYVLN